MAWQQFICRVCGLIYDEAKGDADSGLAPWTRFEDIPDDWACPICGVGKADFEPYTPPAAAAAARVTARTAPLAHRPGARREAGVVIVGAGRAGWQAAQALREANATLPITVVSACSGDVYDKPTLSVAVARGLAVEGLVRESAAAAAARLSVRLLCHAHAVSIDAPRRQLRTTRGTLKYQHLVLAHGAEPALPAVLPAALVWRVNDLTAYTALRTALAQGPQRLAIVGAGLVGCELANDLALAGHTVTLLDCNTRPLAAQVPEEASLRLLQAWRGLPIRFIGGVQVAGADRVDAGADLQQGYPAQQQAAPATPTSSSASAPRPAGPLRLRLAGGDTLVADVVIAATGLRAPCGLARSAGLLFDERAGGVVVSADTGSTSVRGIYALGDCVVVNGQASRYIEPIALQARGLATAIAGARAVSPRPPCGGAEPHVQPLLRVKTSALPITVTGTASGAWLLDADTADELRMHCNNAQGQTTATLTARPAAASPRLRGATRLG